MHIGPKLLLQLSGGYKLSGIAKQDAKGGEFLRREVNLEVSAKEGSVRMEMELREPQAWLRGNNVRIGNQSHGNHAFQSRVGIST